MFRVNKGDNNIVKLEQRLFSDLGFKERDHLQEWIAKNPDILGEELMIIQKEFQGFNDTNERLDLLALDKEGGIVVIENKLDDTGRDVVWQGLKYTSYCSTLTNEQIIKIYQDYLDAYEGGGDAREKILEFLDRESDEDLLLNNTDQRIFFIANNYRKEVTSTVLWLLDHDIDIRCFKATPYSLGEEIFLQIEQIIPLPETAEYIIDAKEKLKEKKGKSKKVEQTNAELIEFWGMLKNKLEEQPNNFLERVSAGPYFSIGFWSGNAKFNYCIGKNAMRVELYIRNDDDKTFFESMFDFKEEIDSKMNGVEWQRLDGKRSARIKVDMSLAEQQERLGKWSDKSSWDDNIDWFIQKMNLFHKVMNPYLEQVKEKLK